MFKKIVETAVIVFAAVVLCIVPVKGGEKHATEFTLQGKVILEMPSDSDAILVYNASGGSVEVSIGEFQDMLYQGVLEYKKSTRLMSLEEYEKEHTGIWELLEGWHPCGIACPECGVELEKFYPDPHLLVYRHGYSIRCPDCGWKGTTY